jgi:uncharacterized membrane protein
MNLTSKLPSIALAKSRMEALTDGIFAIVMTLLVLDLKVPELARDATQGELLARLHELRPFFFSFTLTFILAAAFWFFHHVLFHFIRHVTRPLVWLNVFFLLFVSLLPFSTAFMGRYIHQKVAVMFYFGNLLILALLLKVQWIYAERAGLIATDADDTWKKHFAGRTSAMAFGYGTGLLFAIHDPQWGFNASAIAMVVALAAVRIRGRKAVPSSTT